MEAVVKGYKVDTMSLVIRKLEETEKEKGKIMWGMIVIFIGLCLNVEFTIADEPGLIRFSDKNLLDGYALQNMGMVKKVRSREWYLILSGEPQEEAVSEEEPTALAGEESSARRGKRLRTVTGSSSYLGEDDPSAMSQVLEQLALMSTRVDSLTTHVQEQSQLM